jgi:FkbM family methyltransferase
MDKSQHKESQYIASFIRNKKIKCPKTFIDIGSADGITISNSYFFIKNGWNAVLTDPLPKYYKHSINIHKDNKNVQVFDNAISMTDGIVYFNEADTHSKIHHKGIEVESISYDNLLKKSGYINKEIGILSIDVEGFEMSILTQVLHTKNLPYFIITESNTPIERSLQIDLLNIKYDLINVLSVNTLWVKRGLIKRTT